MALGTRALGIVVDPGHQHLIGTTPDVGGGPSGASALREGLGSYLSSTNKTGISIENIPAKSAVSVSIDADDAGEHLPLVYVLICQKVA
jgi:hypothetical protein